MGQNEKRRRFVRLAEKRVTRTIKDLELIGNLANRHNYDYTDEDSKKILAALEHELRQLRLKFSVSDRDSKTFKL
jgi:hypothetical protein